ncbi:MAG: hypothetical protein WD042_00070 [Phycisphaeraceae bacterium]
MLVFAVACLALAAWLIKQQQAPSVQTSPARPPRMLPQARTATVQTPKRTAPEPLPVRAAPPADPVLDPQKSATCAVLVDPGASSQIAAVAALLEQALADEPRLNLLDRSIIDAALNEQVLATAFAGDASSARVQLGRILKADVLVMLRKSLEEDEGAADLIVTDTSLGLRAVVQTIDVGHKPEAIAAATHKLVARGLERLREPIGAIVAVPPFIDDNLTTEHRSLQDALATICEQAVLTHPNVFIVAFDEAQALSRETTISGATKLGDRGIPLYVKGSYKHERTGTGPAVRLRLNMSRGESSLAWETPEAMPEEQVGPFCAEAVGRLLAKSIGAPAKVKYRETVQLQRRIGELRDAGDRKAAIRLAEAAILLDPADIQARIEAVELLGSVSQKLSDRRDDPEQRKANLEQSVQMWLRAMDVYEELLAKGLLTEHTGRWVLYRELLEDLQRRVDRSRFSWWGLDERVTVLPRLEVHQAFVFDRIKTMPLNRRQGEVLRALRFAVDKGYTRQRASSELLEWRLAAIAELTDQQNAYIDMAAVWAMMQVQPAWEYLDKYRAAHESYRAKLSWKLNAEIDATVRECRSQHEIRDYLQLWSVEANLANRRRSDPVAGWPTPPVTIC